MFQPHIAVIAANAHDLLFGRIHELRRVARAVGGRLDDVARRGDEHANIVFFAHNIRIDLHIRNGRHHIHELHQIIFIVELVVVLLLTQAIQHRDQVDFFARG